MRTIGKRNRTIVINITNEEMEKSDVNILDRVKDRLPVEMWDSWEMADSEITRIIYDTFYTKRVI